MLKFVDATKAQFDDDAHTTNHTHIQKRAVIITKPERKRAHVISFGNK